MTKRILWLTMTALCALSLSAKPHRAKNAQLFEVDGLHYQITNTTDMEIEVTYAVYNKSTNYQGLVEITIPSYVTYADQVYTVVGIGEYAFSNCATLAEVHLPSTVQAIGEYAFYKTSLETALIPRGVKTIGMAAFSGCSALVQIVLPSTLQSLGNNVFYNSKSIKSVTCYALVPPTATNMTFYTSLFTSASLYVPTSAIGVYRAASQWKRFTNILAVDAPEQEPIVEPKPGDDNDNFQPWHPDENPIESADDAYPCPDALDGYCGPSLQWSLSADNTVLTITGTGAMYNYYSDQCVPWRDVRGQICQVILPEGITYIGHHAFFGCVQLKNISSLDGIRIGTLAFGKCPRLQK